jgi:hypothetical protein
MQARGGQFEILSTKNSGPRRLTNDLPDFV